MHIFADRLATARGRMQLFTIGACVLSALAFTTSAQAAVSGTHSVAVLFNSDGLELDGYTPDAALDVTLTRGGVLVGHATGIAAFDAKAGSGVLNVNPDACWIGTTPQVLPGDVVTVTGDGPADSMTVENITTGVAQTGTAPNTIVVHGTAQDAAGHQLSALAIESRLITTGRFSDGKKSLRTTVTYDSPTSTNWTATYSVPDAGDRAVALASTARGVYAALVNEVSIAENPSAPGPAAPCTAPLASNGVTSSDHVYKGSPTVNAANVTSALGLSGVAQADVSAVTVKVTGPGAGTTSTVDGTLSAGGGAQTWTATIPAADVAGLADGTLTAAATFTTPAGTIGGSPLLLAKDTVAPDAPDASPGGGSYTTAQSVSLFDTDTGATMFYTTNGSTPGTSANITTKLFSTPIAVSSSLAIKALALDTAGNVSAVATNTYTLVASPKFTPNAIDYGSQSFNTPSAGVTVTLKNNGAADMTISAVTFTGPNAGDFLRGISTCTGATLAPAETCTVDNVRFQPQANGTRTAALTFSDDAPGGTHSVALTGSGFGFIAPAPIATLTPTSLAFGSQTTGGTSAAQTVSVKNTGNAPLVIGTTPVTGDFVKGADTCASATVAPAATCTVDVRFAPATTGAKTGTLSINDSAAGSPHAVSLSGTGVAPTAPLASLTPASRTYASQAVGTTSTAQTATMTNAGNAPMTLSVALAGTNAGDYLVASSTCSTTLAVAASCTVGVTFKPTATGTRTAALRFTDNSGNVVGSTQDVTLTGTAVVAPAPAITVTPASLNLGTSKVGGLLGIGATTTTANVSVTNSGNAPLAITTSTIGAAASSSFPADYTIMTNGCANKTLAAGAPACVITIKFGAKAKGTRNATLTINSNAPTGPKTVALTGLGA